MKPGFVKATLVTCPDSDAVIITKKANMIQLRFINKLNSVLVSIHRFQPFKLQIGQLCKLSVGIPV